MDDIKEYTVNNRGEQEKKVQYNGWSGWNLDDPFNQAIIKDDFSLAELQEQFSFLGDLETKRKAALRQQKMWGFVEFLKDRRIVQSEDEYEMRFDRCTVTEAGIRGFQNSIEKGNSGSVIFNPGLSLIDLVTLMRDYLGIPFHNTYALKKAGAIRCLPPAADLVDKEDFYTRLKLKQGYEHATTVADEARIIFSTEEKENNSERTAIEHLQSGNQFVDPVTSLISWLSRVDVLFNGHEYTDFQAYKTALQKFLAESDNIPTAHIVRQYPQFILPNGRILSFNWDPKNRCGFLSCYDPSFSGEQMAPHPAFT